MCTSLPSICLDADRRSPAHGKNYPSLKQRVYRVVLREGEAAGATAKYPIPLPPRLAIESRTPMTSDFRMAESPEINDFEYHFLLHHSH